jgi:hypothetical protein
MGRFPTGAREFSLLHTVQTAAGAHPTSYSVGAGALSPGVNRPECEAGHSPATIAEVKNAGTIPPLSHISS